MLYIFLYLACSKLIFVLVNVRFAEQIIVTVASGMVDYIQSKCKLKYLEIHFSMNFCKTMRVRKKCIFWKELCAPKINRLDPHDSQCCMH